MKKLLWAVASTVLASATLQAQENIFIGNTGSNTVSAYDAGTQTAVPTAVANPIPVGVGPNQCFYDSARRLVYVVNSNSGSVSVIDPNLFTVTATIQFPDAANIGGATISSDNQFLFVSAFENIPKRAAVFQLDLNNLTNAGAKLVSGLTPGDGRGPSDVEVLPASAVGGSGRAYMIVQSQLYQIDLPPATTSSAVLVPPVAGTNPPAGPTQMARSPDGKFILLTSTTSSAIGVGSVWQPIRLNPLAATQLDFFVVNNLGNAGNSIDDILFLPNGSVAMLGRDDAGPKVVTYNVGASGGATGTVIGPGINASWGGGFSYDQTKDRYFINANGSTGSPNDYIVYDPAAAVKVFQVTSGGSGPRGFAFAPQPPPMSVDIVTQPAGITSSAFQLELQGKGFIQGSSVARIQDNGVGILTPATSTTVLDSNTIIASWPGQGSAQQYDVSVLNNDGQLSVLGNYYAGLPAAPLSPSVTVNLPPLVSGYSMLSFPQYASVGDLRNAVATQLGQYNPILFRLFLWEGTRYRELNDPALSPAQSIMGTGFFALSRLGDKLSLAAPDVYQNRPAAGGNQRVVVLSPGWNMVSQPWRNTTSPTFTIQYSNVTATPNRDLTGAVAATAGTITTPVAIELVGGVYVGSLTMTANKAYWIENLTAGPLYMVFDQGLVTLKSIPMGKSGAPLSLTHMPPAPPGSSLNDSGSSRGGCGLLGADALLVLLFLRLRRRRTLSA